MESKQFVSMEQFWSEMPTKKADKAKYIAETLAGWECKMLKEEYLKDKDYDLSVVDVLFETLGLYLSSCKTKESYLEEMYNMSHITAVPFNFGPMTEKKKCENLYEQFGKVKDLMITLSQDEHYEVNDANEERQHEYLGEAIEWMATDIWMIMEVRDGKVYEYTLNKCLGDQESVIALFEDLIDLKPEMVLNDDLWDELALSLAIQLKDITDKNEFIGKLLEHQLLKNYEEKSREIFYENSKEIKAFIKTVCNTLPQKEAKELRFAMNQNRSQILVKAYLDQLQVIMGTCILNKLGKTELKQL